MTPIKLSEAIASADGLADEDRQTVRDLVYVWQQHLNGNRRRQRYYDSEITFNDVNIGSAVPKEIADRMDIRSAWPRLAVQAMATRCILDGFYIADGTDGGLSEVVDMDAVTVGFNRAKINSLVHGCSFATVGAGDRGEKPAVVNFHDATVASALYDFRSQKLRAGMVIVDVDTNPRRKTLLPTAINVYLKNAVVFLTSPDSSNWSATYLENDFGRPLMEPIKGDMSGGKPFGESILSDGVLSIVDGHLREEGRIETNREYNAAPQKYMLGASDEDFEHSRVEMSTARMLVASSDPQTGEKPQVGQFPQVTVDTQAIRLKAMEFSGITHVPLADLGFDANANPSSAEAIYAQKEPLVLAANAFNKACSISLGNVARLALAVASNKPVADVTEWPKPIFENPAMPSLVTQADAMVKAVSPEGAQWAASTSVYWEMQGFTEEQRTRMFAEKKRIDAQNALGLVIDDGNIQS